MPRKRKSDLARSSSRARAAKVSRTQESQEQTQTRMASDVKRHASHRAAETDGKRQARQLLDAQRHATQSAAETQCQNEERRRLDAEYHTSQRAADNEEEREARRLLDLQRHRTQRAAETEDQTQARRRLDADRHASVIAAESHDESQRRRILNAERQSQRRNAFARTTWETFQDAAFDYDLLIDYINHRLVLIGRMAKKCTHCEALKWKEETLGMCCSGGKVSLPSIPLLYDSNESQHFLNIIRKYNSCFQLTSFGVGNEVVMSVFSTTFTIQGQVYHRIGSLLSTNDQPKFLQIYFMGDENNEVDRRCQNIQGVDRDIVLKIQRMLHYHNSLINTFKTVL